MGAPTDRELFRQMARECVAFRAQRASRMVTRLFDLRLAKTGLTSTQLTLLSAIANRPDHNSQELADVLGADASSVSRGLSLLVKKKLVRAISSQRDKRAKLYELTSKGAALARNAFDAWEEAQKEVRDVLGASTFNELTSALDRVARLRVDR